MGLLACCTFQSNPHDTRTHKHAHIMLAPNKTDEPNACTGQIESSRRSMPFCSYYRSVCTTGMPQVPNLSQESAGLRRAYGVSYADWLLERN